MTKCSAVLNLRGEDYPCDMECVDAYGEPTQGHEGWAHANREAQAVWAGPEERDQIEGLQDRMQEQGSSEGDWVSGRGFTFAPERTGTYGGHVQVYESSAASRPCVWVRAQEPGAMADDGTPDPSRLPQDAAVHLTVEDALRFAKDIIRICSNHYQTRD